MNDWAIYDKATGLVRLLITFGGKAVAELNARSGEAVGEVTDPARPLGVPLRFVKGALVPVEAET